MVGAIPVDRRRARRAAIEPVAVWLVLLGMFPGCASWKLHSHWCAGGRPRLVTHAPLALHTPLIGRQTASRELLAQAGDAYERAESLARRRHEPCVDAFYRATLLAWSAHQAQGSDSHSSGGDSPGLRLYHLCLGRLIHEGQQFGRLRPSAGIQIREGNGWRVVPMVFHGFAWRPVDFHELHVVGGYHHKTLKSEITCSGIGVPLVVSRPKHDASSLEGEFLPHQMVFAATAVLRADGSALELFDPLHPGAVEIDGVEWPLAKDLSAPLAYLMHHEKSNRLEGFLRPDQPDVQPRLFFLEPYQPDKIPLVFVHGLLSDPRAWAGVYNQLRACPDLVERYQVWVFKYPTGQSFLYTASLLRQQLNEVAARLDPEGRSDTLRQTVLIGHSMGGLIAKLQVTYSGDDVWYTAANLPLEDVATTDSTRARLAQACFFDPQRLVRRVIFVATPHRGSALAHRSYGRVASSLVSTSDEMHNQLTRDNIGGWKPYVARRMPTSIDMLDPDSPLLVTLRRLPVASDVVLHSIIGRGRPMLGDGDSDGVVPVTSARHRGVRSELEVKASHSSILADEETLAELKRILRLHAGDMGL